MFINYFFLYLINSSLKCLYESYKVAKLEGSHSPVYIHQIAPATTDSKNLVLDPVYNPANERN